MFLKGQFPTSFFVTLIFSIQLVTNYLCIKIADRLDLSTQCQKLLQLCQLWFNPLTAKYGANIEEARQGHCWYSHCSIHLILNKVNGQAYSCVRLGYFHKWPNYCTECVKLTTSGVEAPSVWEVESALLLLALLFESPGSPSVFGTEPPSRSSMTRSMGILPLRQLM